MGSHFRGPEMYDDMGYEGYGGYEEQGGYGGYEGYDEYGGME